MADEEQLERLECSVQKWNEWRKEHPEILPDFIGADLSDADLSRANLMHAYFCDADLSYADLSRADLNGTLLTWVKQSCKEE